MMEEIPFFYKSGNFLLFGIIHKPQCDFKSEGFVFCHPFAEEKLWSHRVYVNFARELSSRGYTILRFDYMGHGDSQGNFEDSSVETRILDINNSIHTLKVQAPYLREINLIGLRFGATLAFLTTMKNKDINSLILMDPVFDGQKYMKNILRSNLATQNAVYKEIRHTRAQLIELMQNGSSINFDGYELSYPFFKQASSINILSDKDCNARKILLIQIEKSLDKPKNKLHHSFLTNFPHADHKICIEKHFWKEIPEYYSRANNLYSTTIEWLENNE